ncbi:MAG: hypothetical protein RMY29_011265 [Nostoc sp. CreGUA01]|nr:hypothetical protein [Nostoc sp. CreGUA01]
MTISTYLPTTFADAIACVQQFALQVFDRQNSKNRSVLIILAIAYKKAQS